jgi:hypothetical protein
MFDLGWLSYFKLLFKYDIGNENRLYEIFKALHLPLLILRFKYDIGPKNPPYFNGV